MLCNLAMGLAKDKALKIKSMPLRTVPCQGARRNYNFEANRIIKPWQWLTHIVPYILTRLLENLFLCFIFKNWFMLSVRISSYGCTREVWRARKKRKSCSKR